MARKHSPAAQLIEYAALRAVNAAMQMFPMRRNLKTARLAGAAMHRFDRKHRQRAMHNIRRSLPHLSEPEADRIARASVQHFLQLGVEVLFTTRLIQRATWSNRVTLDDIGPGLDAVLGDRPAILVSGHYGNWEVLGYTMGLLGADLTGVARPIDNPYINDWLLGVREAQGMRIITKFGATDAMLDIMRRGGALGFVGDQNAGDRGMFVPFFGRLASAYKSIGLLAMRFDAPVICGYARRVGDDFRYVVGTTDIITPQQYRAQPDPLYYITARYTRAIETMIREAPQQYLWIHRRWKSRPRHEREGKPLPGALRAKLEALPWMDAAQLESLAAPDVAVLP